MFDLFDLFIGGALNLDHGGRWRSADPEPPPLPPGIPALPPDPRAIAVGVAATRAHDPGFDEGPASSPQRCATRRDRPRPGTATTSSPSSR
ncbi:MAG: hypothetical protein QOG45_1062 [Chloroflexota bacterium]|jgi:hypothetical protein|nr:hypothetical protein [Chloroflexota bacterium]